MCWSGWQAPTRVVEKACLRRKHLSWVTRGTSHGKTGRRIFLAREVSTHRPKGGISFMCSGITRWLAWWVRWASEDGRGPLCRKLRAGEGSWKAPWADLHYEKLIPWALEARLAGEVRVGMRRAELMLSLLSQWDDQRLSTELMGISLVRISTRRDWRLCSGGEW